MRKILIISLFCYLFIICVEAEMTYSQEAKHSAYYYQKKELFKQLPNRNNEIIFLGDSITDGCEWSEILNNPNVINRGISGDTTDGVLERLEEITESRPQIILLMIGVNDLASGKSVASILQSISRIIKRIQKHSPTTILYVQSLLPVNNEFNHFSHHTNKTNEILAINKGLRLFCNRYKVFYIDLHTSFSVKNNRLNPAYTNDGLHLTGKGYIHWKSVIEKYLKSCSH